MEKKDLNYLWKNNIHIPVDDMTAEEIIKLCRESVKKHSYFKVKEGKDKGLCDVQTANAIITVYDNLKLKNKEKFKRLIKKMGFGWIGHKSWELLGKCT